MDDLLVFRYFLHSYSHLMTVEGGGGGGGGGEGGGEIGQILSSSGTWTGRANHTRRSPELLSYIYIISFDVRLLSLFVGNMYM